MLYIATVPFLGFEREREKPTLKSFRPSTEINITRMKISRAFSTISVLLPVASALALPEPKILGRVRGLPCSIASTIGANCRSCPSTNCGIVAEIPYGEVDTYLCRLVNTGSGGCVDGDWYATLSDEILR